MQDAARLAMPDASGGILWHPATLDDIYSVPHRVMLLFDYYRAGMASRMEPWSWWRVVEKPLRLSHQYNTDWRSRPMPPARCGFVTPSDAAFERAEAGKCAKCSKLDKGESIEATGTVAGVRVGPARDHHPER